MGRRFSAMIVLALGAAGLAACQAGKPEAPVPQQAPAHSIGLGGTAWRLLEVQSMDDAQGTTKPDDPSKYTIAFNADGTVSAKLDCNRATGSWVSKGENQIEFAPLAVTRALCPPPSISDKVATDLGYVRSYILKDGKLYLSLMADGGILVWEPAIAAH